MNGAVTDLHTHFCATQSWSRGSYQTGNYGPLIEHGAVPLDHQNGRLGHAVRIARLFGDGDTQPSSVFFLEPPLLVSELDDPGVIGTMSDIQKSVRVPSRALI